MDSLRWILLLIGAALVAAIWWTGHRRNRERDETLLERVRRDPGDDREPAGLEADPTPDFDIASLEEAAPRDTEPVAATPRPDDPTEEASEETAVPAASGGAAARGRAAPAEGPDERQLEAVYVVAARGERFIGSRLQELFEQHDLEHGELDIYHRRDAEGHTLFSVANLVEPGTFDPATIDTLSTPGVALFLRLPGPPSAETAFERMMECARALADALDARMLDQQHSTLTRQTEQHLRDRMREFDHQQQRSRR